MNNDINFSPLASYSKFFLFFRFVKRLKMVIVRLFWILLVLAVLGGLIYVIFVMTPLIGTEPADAETTTYSADYDLGPGLTYLFMLIFVAPAFYFVPLLLTVWFMDKAWADFARRNGFKRLQSYMPEAKAIMQIPSFKGKLLSTSIGPITGVRNGLQFALHTRQYKEGGVLRWREQNMDTVLTLILPANLPHVVINARGNERARLSNMTVAYPQQNRFQFEGPLGSHYDVYADSSARILALQLFTPDVLEVMYEKLPTADIEMRGDTVWIIQRYGVLNDIEGQRMFEAGAMLYGELEKQMTVAGLLVVKPATAVQ